jgi:hypothetical protein
VLIRATRLNQRSELCQLLRDRACGSRGETLARGEIPPLHFIPVGMTAQRGWRGGRLLRLRLAMTKRAGSFLRSEWCAGALWICSQTGRSRGLARTACNISLAHPFHLVSLGSNQVCS